MALSKATRQKLIWGYARLLLGTAQMLLASIAIALLLTTGLHWLTLCVATAATIATLTSRLLYRGRPDPRN